MMDHAERLGTVPMTWLAGDWSRLHHVTDRDGDPWFNACEDRPGLYRLVGLSDAATLNPATLDRVCGSDPSGTIYIGSGGSLRRRIGHLVMQHDSDRYRTQNHKKLPDRLSEKFSPGKLAVCWSYLDKEINRYAEESKLIAAYVGVFGEAPPLNAML